MNGLVRLPVVSLAVLAACSGEGSDIGPKLAKLPDASCKVVVLDDQGRGVVGATVAVGSGPVTAVTGRNGRADLLANPRGLQRFVVDGANGAAVAGDRLATLAFATTVVGPDLPSVVFLPDLPDSASATLVVGTQAGATSVTSVTGGVLTVGAGSSVGLSTGASTVTVRVGDLTAAHLPGELPAGSGAALLFGRGFHVDPPTVSFTPPASLDLEDDLELPNGVTATLYHLDSASGLWTVVATGVPGSGGRIALAGAVGNGGLYAFGCAVPAATVTARLVDTAGLALPDVMVGIDGRWTRSDVGGRFTLADVPGRFADASPRAAAIEFFAGGSWLPVRSASTAAVAPGAVADLGDVTLDTVPAGNLRVQQVKRGRAEPLRRAAVSTAFGSVALVTTGDQNGQSLFEDVPGTWFGFQEGYPIDFAVVYYTQFIGYLDPGRRWLDAYQYFDKVAWVIGSSRSRTLVTDSLGGGPIDGATVVSGSVDGQGFAGFTEESGALFVDRDFSGRATATWRTQRDGNTIVHAFSIERPNGEHLELPMRQVLRTPLGAFDRHGLVAGTLTGADPAREHRLRTTRRIELQEWWADVVEGRPLPSSLPIDVDPATTHAAFRAGVAAAGGNLAAVEVSTVGAVTTLEKVGIVADFVPAEGAVLARDVPLDLPATTTFTTPGGLVGLDAAIDPADLQFALALAQGSGRVVDVARGLGGNLAVAGSDLRVTLPALSGQLAGQRWLAIVRGSTMVGSATLTQQVLLRLSGNGAEPSVPFLPVPDITSPAPDATVAATGFPVQFTLPANTLYATIELRSEVGGELLLWDVTLPPDLVEFSFWRLPTEATTPLVAGRTYTLSLTAYRADGPPLTGPEPYRDLESFLQSIGAAERGVTALATRTITVTAN